MTEDRILRALRAIVRELLPRLGFYGLYEYRVVQQAGATVDLQAIRKGVGLPDLRDVEPWPGASGQGAALALGSSVLVGFVEADPSRPFIAFYAPASGGGYLPIGLTIDATGTVSIGPTASEVNIGAGADAVNIASGSTVVLPGDEIGRPVRYGDILAGPTSLSVPYTVALAVPGATPVSKVRA